MEAKARFNALREELGQPLDVLARELRRPYGTVKAWASPSRVEMVPPQDVLAAMDEMALERARSRIRAAGYEVIRRRAA